MSSQRRKVIFRADATSEIGGGHVMRCLTLAEHLTAKGWDASFACVGETLAIVPRLRDRVDVFEAQDRECLDAGALSQRWPSGCDILVVDHYALGAAFEASCRGWARRIVVIDDLANRPHDCDLLIDTTLGRQAQDYAALVPPTAVILAGPSYALLRPGFADYRQRSLARRATLNQAKRVLVSLGLTDMGGFTAPIVRALLDLDSTISIDVILGASARSRSELEGIFMRSPRISLFIDPPDVAKLMTDADIAIGAGGTTSWERCCLGLPTVLIILAENQILVAKSLEEAGAVIVAEKAPGLTQADFAASVAHMVADIPSLQKMSSAAAVVTDGGGTGRIADTIEVLISPMHSEARLELRMAAIEDSELILTWRNDPLSRANFRNTDIVPRADHEFWFGKMLNDPKNTMLIGLISGEPIGIVRFDQQVNGEYEVSINLAPESRGKGLGNKLLASACAVFLERSFSSTLLAHIKTKNISSRRIFEANQFERITETDDFIVYRRFDQRVRS
jgi:UDP-2,4-diacetamido-2,4,6-trideoxy-beta-L-altropyranose hydrolase